MSLILSILSAFLFYLCNISPAFAVNEYKELPECIFVSHCSRTEWKVNDVDNFFTKTVQAVATTPRTKIIEQTGSYIHAEAKTKWMRYTDDLLIKAFPDRGIIQVRSESRVGIGDNGVNKKRIDDLAYRLMTNQTN